MTATDSLRVLRTYDDVACQIHFTHRANQGVRRGLNVVCQEVVDIESGSADGWFLIYSGMRSMPVALVGPRREMAESIGGVLIEASVGPLAECRCWYGWV